MASLIRNIPPLSDDVKDGQCEVTNINMKSQHPLHQFGAVLLTALDNFVVSEPEADSLYNILCGPPLFQKDLIH